LLKAYFRRGVARAHFGLSEEAREDLQSALTIDPNNGPVKAEIV